MNNFNWGWGLCFKHSLIPLFQTRIRERVNSTLELLVRTALLQRYKRLVLVLHLQQGFRTVAPLLVARESLVVSSRQLDLFVTQFFTPLLLLALLLKLIFERRVLWKAVMLLLFGYDLLRYHWIDAYVLILRDLLAESIGSKLTHL